MPVIELTTRIVAPIDRVFDLARCIDLHVDSTPGTGERAIAGVTTGLIGLGDEVTWRARHFGVWQTLTSRITRFDRPTCFTDVMVRGAFRRLEHQHIFESTAGGWTVMHDVFIYEAPMGILGRFADRLFLERYMENLLLVRNRIIKSVAESFEWPRYLEPV